VRLGQRSKEDVHRCVSLFDTRHVGLHRLVVADFEALVRRHDIRVVRLDGDRLRHLGHGHRRPRLKDFGEPAVMVGRQVKDDDHAIPACGGTLAKNVSSFLMPPADAPMPTTAGRDGLGRSGSDASFGSLMLATGGQCEASNQKRSCAVRIEGCCESIEAVASKRLGVANRRARRRVAARRSLFAELPAGRDFLNRFRRGSEFTVVFPRALSDGTRLDGPSR
jgi:hypothetical protein